MPEIPSLPVTQPVELPRAKPGIYAQVGDTIAGLGQETEQLAQANAQVAGHLIEADRYLKVKQAEIAFDHELNQVHEDLRKAVTPEDAQAVYEHAKGRLAGVLAPFETDRVLSRHLAIFGQQQDVQLQNVVNSRKATLIQHADNAANETLYDKSKQEAVNTVVAGGKADVAEAQLKAKLDASVHVMGTMTPEQEAGILQKFHKDVQSGVLDANINSPNVVVRQQTIDQLESGKGSLDLSALSQDDINKFLTHAKHVNQSLTQLDEVKNLNADIDNTQQTFKSAPYVDDQGNPNFDNILSSFKSGDFLMSHGIITKDPSTGKVIPDYVRGAKLEAFYKGAESDFYLGAKKKADAERDEIYDQFAQGHIQQGLNMARKYLPDFQKAKVDYYPQIIGAAKGWQYEQMAEWRFGKAEERAARDDKLRAAEEKGYSTQDQLLQRITNGEELDFHRDIESQIHAGNMTNKQGHDIWYDYNQTTKSPDYHNGLAIINNSAIPVVDKAKAAIEFRKAYRQGGLTGTQVIDKAQQIVEAASGAHVNHFFQNLWNNLKAGNPLGAAQTPTTTQQPATVPEGSEKINAAGDHVVFHNGRWEPAQ